MSDEDTKTLHAALFLISNIRAAIGDPKGKLMQDELVAHCGELLKRAEKYDRLNESLAKNKRLFSDAYSQSVIESQVKRIKKLKDDLSLANCTIDKMRNQPHEIICTKCGLREQRGEKPSADF